MTDDTPLKVAVRRAGGPKALAESLGVTVSSVAHWKHIPDKWLLHVARLTGMTIEELRPDRVRDASKLPVRVGDVAEAVAA